MTRIGSTVSGMLLNTRTHVVVLLAACVALLSQSALAQTAGPIDQANISWFSNKEIVACAQFSISANQSCWVVADASNSLDVTNVLQGAFVGNVAASWIEERKSGYTLCVLTANRFKMCEPIPMAHVVGTKLSLAKSPKGGKQISLGFPKVISKASTRQVIGHAFLHQYWEAKQTLVSKLNFSSHYAKPFVTAGTGNSTSNKLFQANKIVGVSTNLCVDDDCGDPGDGDPGDPGDGGGGGGDPGDPGDGGGDGGGSTAGGGAACIAVCSAAYSVVVDQICRNIPITELAAIGQCYSAAANDLQACLARC